MRISYICFILILFLSCSNNEKLNGLWYGEFKTKQGRSPALVKFQNGNFIDYFSGDYDTIKYKYFRNTFRFKNFMHEKMEYRVKLNNSEMFLFDSKTDSLIVKFNRREQNNFVFDYLNDKSLILDVPSGIGLENTFGRNRRFGSPLYLTYQNNKLVANFLDSTSHIDTTYYKFLIPKIEYSEHEFIDLKIPNVLLISDKNIKISDLNLIKKQLKISGFSNVDYFLKTQSYDKLNTFNLRLQSLSEDDYDKYYAENDPRRIPVPFLSPLQLALKYKENLFLIKINGSSIKLNDKVLTRDALNQRIKNKILSDKDLNILYYITDSSNYQDFISFNEVILNAYFDLRDEYLIEKYGVKFRGYRSMDDKVREAYNAYPLILQQIDSSEYEKIKYSL